MTIGDFSEITISGSCERTLSGWTQFWKPIFLFTENSELKNILSSISGIPEENIEYAMVGHTPFVLPSFNSMKKHYFCLQPSGLFPRYNLNVMTMHQTSLTWCSSTVRADEWPLNSAHNSDCFIFRWVLKWCTVMHTTKVIFFLWLQRQNRTPKTTNARRESWIEKQGTFAHRWQWHILDIFTATGTWPQNWCIGFTVTRQGSAIMVK